MTPDLEKRIDRAAAKLTAAQIELAQIEELKRQEEEAARRRLREMELDDFKSSDREMQLSVEAMAAATENFVQAFHRLLGVAAKHVRHTPPWLKTAAAPFDHLIGPIELRQLLVLELQRLGFMGGPAHPGSEYRVRETNAGKPFVVNVGHLLDVMRQNAAEPMKEPERPTAEKPQVITPAVTPADVMRHRLAERALIDQRNAEGALDGVMVDLRRHQ
jgi:hypothetical protein